jgi:hypothetical protein
LWFYEPIRLHRHVNHLIGISCDFDWSNGIAICCDCTESNFKCEYFDFKAMNVCLLNKFDGLFWCIYDNIDIASYLNVLPYPGWVFEARQDVPV